MGFGGMFSYMFIGFFFLFALIMGSQIIHAANSPKVGDVVNCNDICDITNKHIVLDNFGMYDYYVTCSNGITYSLNDYDDYVKLPYNGSVWVRGSSIRMRTGLSMNSWLNIKYATSNIQNACVITSGDVSERKEETSCLDNSGWPENKIKDIKNTFFETEICFINQTLKAPLT